MLKHVNKVLQKKSLELLYSEKIYAAIIAISLVFSLVIPFESFNKIFQNAEGASILIAPPPDKKVISSGSSTRVSLGTPEVSGTTDSNPTISHNAPGQTPAPTGAVAYWSFDDDLNDRSGNKNHGVAKGNARIVSSHMTKALLLDGSGDYVKVDDSWKLRLTGAFTLSTWIKFDTLTPNGSYVRILEKGTSPGEKYWMFYVKSSKQVGFGFISPDGDINLRASKTDWKVGQWYHIVGTYNPSGGSNNMKIYVNGVLDSQATRTGKPAANSEPLMIGTKSTANGDFWQGEIDEVHIYGKALTATDITALHKSPFVSLPPGTNEIVWTVKDADGNSANAIQAVNVHDQSLTAPVTSLVINGVRYVDSTTGKTFVTSGSHFDLIVQSSISLQGTYFRFFKDSEIIRPNFSAGKYFKINEGTDGEYVVQFYSVDINGVRETLREKRVILDNSTPMTSIDVVAGGSSTGKIRLSASDNYEGAGVGNKLASGIYYKLDSAMTYTFVQASTIEVENVVNGAHTIYYYSVDNLGNTDAEKTAKFTGVNYTFCSSGCDYNNLQTAINSLPSGGGKILIKDGTYTITNTITLKSGAILEFSSKASILFKGGSKPVFKGTGISNVEIIGGQITSDSDGTKAFSFSGSKGIKVTGTKVTLVKGSNSNAFYCASCTDVFVSNLNAKTASRLVDVKTASGENDGSSRNIWIVNGNYDDASIEGVKVNYSVDVHIVGNTVSNTGDNGIDIGFNKNSEVRENRLSRIGSPNGAAIHTDSTNVAYLIKNHIDTTGQSGITVHRASHVNVIGNTVVNAGNQGINIIPKNEPNSFVQIKSNSIIAPKGIGIYESPEQNQVEIAFNVIEKMPPDVLPIYRPGSNPTTMEYGNVVK
jgi:hypothetical protein